MEQDGTGSGSAGTVVVLDKDSFFRDFQRVLLAGQGFHVVAPMDAADFSVDYVAAQEPDLVVTEILLPGRNGLELVRAFRNHDALKHVRVVVFSVLRAEARAMTAGADRFVQKPLMREGFLATVVETLKSERGEGTK